MVGRTTDPGRGRHPAALLAEQVRRGAIIGRRLRLILVVFFVALMITEPPARNALWCWVVVGGYLLGRWASMYCAGAPESGWSIWSGWGCSSTWRSSPR